MRWGRWLHARWYGYLWRRARPESKVYLGALAFLLLGAGGFYLATIGSSAHASGADAYIVRRTSVVRTVVQVRNGHTIVKRIRSIQTVKLPAHAVTVKSLRTITEAGRVRSIPFTRVKYVPVTKLRTATIDRIVTSVVTRGGKTTTVVSTQPVTVQTTVPVTVQETLAVTQSKTVTDQRTITQPPVTTTVVSTTTTTTTVVHTTTQTRTVTVTTTVAGTTGGTTT